jgi:hypothetical protein
VLPAECNCPERRSRQFGQRVVGYGFAAIQKKRNFETVEDSPENILVPIEGAEQDGTISEPGLLGTDEAKDFPRGE